METNASPPFCVKKTSKQDFLVSDGRDVKQAEKLRFRRVRQEA